MSRLGKKEMPRARSDFICQRRQELRLTQLDLALRADVAPRTLQRAESGKDENSSHGTLRAIARILDVDYEEVLYSEDGTDTNRRLEAAERDAFHAWPWSLSDFISGEATPDPNAFCRSVDDTKLAIRSMRDSWSKHLERTQSLGEVNEFSQADEKLSREYERYEHRYLKIWQTNPNTIVFATDSQERVGCCVVLPVSKPAYDDIRNGTRSFMEINASDVLHESQYLILDSAVELRCTSKPQLFDSSYSLSFALFYQIALLSENPVAESFRMVGFGASPINLERLAGIGFSPCGIKMPDFDFQVCEFSIEDDEQSEETFKRSLTTLHYANLFKIFSLTSVSISEKRKMISKALRLYQRTAKSHASRICRDQDGSAA